MRLTNFYTIPGSLFILAILFTSCDYSNRTELTDDMAAKNSPIDHVVLARPKTAVEKTLTAETGPK